MAVGSSYPASIIDINGNVREGWVLRFDDGANQPEPGAVFVGWTSDAADPANVVSNDGSLDLGTGSLTAGDASFTGRVAADGRGEFAAVVTSPQTSGALTTTTFASGTGKALSDWSSDVTLFVPWTSDGTNNAATLKIELSPDDSTYSTLTTLSVAAALNTIGAVTLLQTLQVPQGWFVKLTAVHCTIGTATGIGQLD